MAVEWWIKKREIIGTLMSRSFFFFFLSGSSEKKGRVVDKEQLSWGHEEQALYFSSFMVCTWCNHPLCCLS